jgi:tetratricopeptide (TPR) repeat protein
MGAKLHRRMPLGAAVFFAAWIPLAAAAQSGTDLESVKDQAADDLADGKPQKACDAIEPLLAANDDDLLLHFLVGQCLAKTGRPRAAIAQYQLILSRDPSAVRARAELAAAEALAGDTASARSNYVAVLAASPPAGIREKLQEALDDVPPRPQWSGYASAAVMYDSNADLGPLRSAFTLFGAPYVLHGIPPQPESDWSVLSTAGVTLTYPVDANWSFLANAAANDVTYAKVRQFDLDSYSLYAGPSYQTDMLTLSLNAGGNVALLNRTAYSTSWGAQPDATVHLGDGMSFDEQVSVQANRYDTTGATDGWSGTSTSALTWNYDGTQAFLEPKLTIGRQMTRDGVYADNQLGGEVDWFHPLPAGFSVLVEPAINTMWFRAVDPAWGTKRRDDTYSLIANLGYEPGFWHSQIALGVSLTANRSNQALYSYNRVQTNLQLKIPF